jgi:pimeloyl-ACP methyl ester carboxylesterase
MEAESVEETSNVATEAVNLVEPEAISVVLRTGSMVTGRKEGCSTHVVKRLPSGTILNLFSRTSKVAVLIHGLGQCNQAWLGFEDLLLAQGIATVSYDMIGRGMSDHEGQFGMEEHVEQLYEDVIKGLLDDFEEVHIVGYSQGGAVATGFAAKYYKVDEMRGKLKSVTAVAPAGLLSRPSLCLISHLPIINLIFYPLLMSMNAQRAAWSLDYDDEQHASERGDVIALYEELHADPERSARITGSLWRLLEEFPLTRMQREVSQLAAKMVSDNGGSSSAESLKFRLVWGDRDTVCPSDNVEEWRMAFAKCDNFQCEILQDMGHNLVACVPSKVLEASGLV